MNRIKTKEETSCLSCKARKFSWFQSGSEEQVQQRQQRRTAQYQTEANHYLFREGDYHPNVYTLKKGWAICYKDFENGQRQIVHVALAGDLLGYRATTDTPIDYSVKTITPCLLCAFSKTDTRQLLTDTHVLYNLMILQSTYNKGCRTQLAYVGQSQAKHRMASFLFHLIKRLKRRGVNIELPVALPLSRIDIANAVGISMIHLGRVSVELDRQGIIECRNNILHVKNYNALKALVEGS